MKDKIIKECKPNPGSDEAVTAGCTCPQMDNEYGKGCGGEFHINMNCPIHTMEMDGLKTQLGIKV